MTDLSEYELQRLAHMKRNHDMLVRLGLVEEAVEAEPKQKQKKRPKLPPAPPESLRRSGRVRKVEPDYTSELIDAHGDELDRKCERGAKRKRAEVAGEDEDTEAARAEMLESTMAFLRAARLALAQFVSSADGEAPTTTDGWRAEAVRRWGEHAGGGAEVSDWKLWVTSRLSQPPPPSPLDLLQEYYAADMWQLLCACVLMSRCSSWATKHRCISAFFEFAPTPSVFLDRVVRGSEAGALKEVIFSLGLFDDRVRSLVSITQAFLNAGEFAVDLAEHKIHGVGKFGYHSWLIFCRDMGGSLKKIEDATLLSFASWRKKQPAEDAAADKGSAGEAQDAVKRE